MKRFTLFLLLTFTLSILFGCPMKPKQDLQATDPAVGQTTPSESLTESNDPNLRGAQSPIFEETITSSTPATVTTEPLSPMGNQALSNLMVIPFDYDQFTLSEEARSLIAANAEILKSQTKIRFQLGGHCDERGSDQYNIALGERRAEAVRSYLLELGIASTRIETVSFGEERPVQAGHDESAWSKNRRCEFQILP